MTGCGRLMGRFRGGRGICGVGPGDGSGLPRRFAPRNDRVLEEVGVEVAPGGVGGFDEGEFAGAGAGFELFFAGDGGGHGGVCS